MPAQIDTIALSEAFRAAGDDPTTAALRSRAMQDIAMKDVPSSADVREAVHTMTVRFGLMLAGAVAILGALITLSN